VNLGSWGESRCGLAELKIIQIELNKLDGEIRLGGFENNSMGFSGFENNLRRFNG
jgi:hypothetical protein